MGNPEQYKNSSERLLDTGEAGEQAAERLKKTMEQSGENQPDKHEQLTSARKETEATFSKESGKESKHGGEPGLSPRFVAKVTKQQKKDQYRQTLKQARSHLSAPSRAFSSFIHNPFVEKSSDLVGSTVARPNALLMGGLTSFILVGFVYIVAKYYGYNLSGAETMLAFAFGWVLGQIIDYSRLMLASRR